MDKIKNAPTKNKNPPKNTKIRNRTPTITIRPLLDLFVKLGIFFVGFGVFFVFSKGKKVGGNFVFLGDFCNFFKAFLFLVSAFLI
jgi:hypothetical protein